MNKITKRSEKNWIRWMELGEKTGCHQRPDRSFYIKGYQMPICARCSGVFLGYLFAIPCCCLKGWRFWKQIALLGCESMLIDWTIQAGKIKESTNKRRLITGLLGGFGIMVFFIGGIQLLFSKIKNYLSSD